MMQFLKILNSCYHWKLKPTEVSELAYEMNVNLTVWCTSIIIQPKAEPESSEIGAINTPSHANSAM